MLNMKTLFFALGLALCAPSLAQGLVNADFDAESGSWHGVACSPSGNTVVGLDLSGNGLIGVVPASITALTDLAPGGRRTD